VSETIIQASKKLVVTGYPSVDDALSVIKSGAVGLFGKTFTKEGEIRRSGFVNSVLIY